MSLFVISTIIISEIESGMSSDPKWIMIVLCNKEEEIAHLWFLQASHTNVSLLFASTH